MRLSLLATLILLTAATAWGQEPDLIERHYTCVLGWVPRDGNVAETFSLRILPCGQTASARPIAVIRHGERRVATASPVPSQPASEIPEAVARQIRAFCAERHPTDFAIRAGCVRNQERGYLESR